MEGIIPQKASRVAVNGLVDISDILRPGVFLLHNHGRIVYIGKAKCLLAGIAVYRAINRAKLPSWVTLHRIQFDRVEIIPCDTTRAIELQRALVSMHDPIHNRTRPEPTPSISIPPSSHPSQPLRRL